MTAKTNHIPEMTEGIRSLIENMFDTMHNTGNGVGLSANQVGGNISLFVVDLSDVEEYKDTPKMVFINPEIIEFSEQTEIYSEGCLSVPGIYEDVTRSSQIKIKFQNIDMTETTQEFSGFLARVIQHEYDHLQGKIFIERISAFRRTLIKNKLKKIKSGKFDADYQML